jgi:adenylate cyclase
VSLFNELKRRNVFRVGIAYLIVAWLLLQVADVMIDNIGAPDWLFQAILLVLAIGFVIALFFAWAFELTPEGLKRESEVDRSRSITPTTGKKLNTAILVLLAVAVVYLLIDRFRQTPVPVTTETQSAEQSTGPVTPTQAQPSSEPSIAVLPFINMSNDPEQEYFSDGISEELLNLLVRVDGLQVASRTSSFTYKGENLDIPEIASELKVDHILEGSVRKAGNRVRITAQLIDAASDRHLWSDTFDRELDDIFAIQDEIANAIVGALQETLGVGLEAVVVRAVTDNLDAYELYLKARSLFIARKNLDQSIELFNQAIALDPEFAPALEGLAAVHHVAIDWLAGDGVDHSALALETADQALKLDSSLSMAYAVKGSELMYRKGQIGAGIRQMDRAIQNDTKNATAFLWRGIMLKDLGYFDHAVGDFESCLAIDQAYLNCAQHLADAHLAAGRRQEAITLFERTLEENFHSTSDSFVAHYVETGQRVSALLLASAAVRRPYAPVRDWVDALEFPEQDQSARVARWQAWATEQNMEICQLGAVIVALKQYSCLDKLDNARFIWIPAARAYRQSPEFKNFARLAFLPYWQEHGFPPQCRAIGEEDFECD